jgi:Tfp pilus assembly ATPase PilU
MQILDTLLQLLAEKGSDLYLTAGSPPMMKIQGKKFQSQRSEKPEWTIR